MWVEVMWARFGNGNLLPSLTDGLGLRFEA
jgi:hypothetical protein